MKLSPEQKLAALAQEIGFEKLDSMFRLLRAYNTPRERKPKTARKEQEVVLAAKVS